MNKLQEQFNKIANAYVKKFVKKHKYEFSYWISDEPGTIACFIEQYYFSFDDIREDIDNEYPKDLIFQWQDDALENQNKIAMNLKSYAMGLRFSELPINPDYAPY
jgi:phenolic acid decarboxylase